MDSSGNQDTAKKQTTYTFSATELKTLLPSLCIAPHHSKASPELKHI